MRATNKRLTILSKAERSALYDLPDFDDIQRQEYFSFIELEREIFLNRPTITAKIHCALQIGYFKAKNAFFRFSWEEVKEDINFILVNYFSDVEIEVIRVSTHEHYLQCNKIAEFFGYRRWSKVYVLKLKNHFRKLIKLDATSNFIIIELVAFLKKEKIIRPGYTTFQTIVSEVLSDERRRLVRLIKKNLNESDKLILRQLLLKGDNLSDLAAVKQDAKNFKKQMMTTECEKLEKLKPLYIIAKRSLPNFKISQQNIAYYASLADYYSVHELREKILPELTHLYLLCYVWQRYRQINDNLVEALCYHINQINKDAKDIAKINYLDYLAKEQKENEIMKTLACFWVDKNIDNNATFGDVRQKVFQIIPEEELRQKVSLDKKQLKEIDFKWKAIDDMAQRIKLNLRPIIMNLDFEAEIPESKWLSAINWLKKIFSTETNLKNKSLSDCPEGTVPKRLSHFLVEKIDHHKLISDRYEYWIYRQLRKRINCGEIYLDDSIRHRSLKQELALHQGQNINQEEINIPALQSPIKIQLDKEFSELNKQWALFDNELKSGKLTHLCYDTNTDILSLKKIKIDDDNQTEFQADFYNQLPLTDITDVLRFANKQCNFLKAFTPIQVRYSKKENVENILLASVIAQAMNHGNLKMAEISNIPYPRLKDVYQSYCRVSTLKLGNDIISNAISKLSIFPFFSLDLTLLYSAVDGQKYEVRHETIKARHSKKHFGKVKGVVAYTLLSNQIPLQLELISPNEHESYYVFDIWYNNTTEIIPEVVTGDMHCINKGNFVIMHWFGAKLFPRFTNAQTQRKHLFCSPGSLEKCSDFLIKPEVEIDRQLIEDEWINLKGIIMTLGLKEISQSNLIKKLCNYTVNNRTRKALFEYDKLIRSIYTLKYLRDPKLQKNINHSQNRIESYHQLRGAIAQTYGKKQLSGKTDTAISISNECGRLVANAIIFYNSIILSKLKEKFEIEKNIKGLEMLRKISPVAWQHIHFLGHYLFSEDTYLDIDLMISKLLLG